MSLGLPALPRVGHNIDWCIMSKVTITVQFLYYKYECQNVTEYRSTLSGVGGWNNNVDSTLFVATWIWMWPLRDFQLGASAKVRLKPNFMFSGAGDTFASHYLWFLLEICQIYIKEIIETEITKQFIVSHSICTVQLNINSSTKQSGHNIPDLQCNEWCLSKSRQ
jgi:hypothetical protein